MSVQSWQISCPRCGWSNSGAERRCGKCGQGLRTAPGLLVAGETAGNVIAPKAPPKRVVQPGGFFPRLIAVIIDALILAVVLVPVYYLWRAQLSQIHLDPNAVNQPNVFSDQLTALGGSALAGSSVQTLTQVGELFLGWDVLVLFYFVGSWTILSGSPGQLVMNLRVVDNSAKGIGFGRGLMRLLFKSLFGPLAPISALLVAVGKDKRAIHDLFAGTYVIQYLDPDRAQGADTPSTPAADVTAAATMAGEQSFPGAAAPRQGQAEARAASAAARAASLAAPAAVATLAAAAQSAPAVPSTQPPGPSAARTVPTPPALSILPEASPIAPAAEPPPAPFYAVPAPAAPDASSFERYTPPPMPGPPSSLPAPSSPPSPPVALPPTSPPASVPPTADAAPTPDLPSTLAPSPPQEEAMPLPPLPAPAPAPEPAKDAPAASSSGPLEPVPGPDPNQGTNDAYPLPFAPLPPVADRPEPPAAAAASGE